jgi:predicted PurR-regulated permease PerM
MPNKWAWGLLGLGAAGLVWWHAAIVAPFVLSLVLAYLLRPPVERLITWHVPRALAVALCLLLALLLMVFLLVLLVPIVSQLAPMLRDQLPALLVGLWRNVAPWLAQWGIDVPTSAEAIQAELVALLQQHGAQWGGALWRSLLLGGSSLMSVLGWVALLPMLAFYWLLDWDRLTGHFRTLVPLRWRGPMHALMDETDTLMGQYLRGQVLVMLILAAYYSAGLCAFGFKLGLPIGVFTGLVIFIPYLGYGLGLLLALLAGLLQFGIGPQGVGHPLMAVGVVYGLGQVIESFILTPRLVGERIGLHPLGVILALMLFGSWLGLWGVMIALPCAALLVVLGRRLVAVYQNSQFYRAE